MRTSRLFPRASHSIRPFCEPLEGRLCLSVTVSTIDLGGGVNELRVVGNGADDVINIADDGSGGVAVTGLGGVALGSATNVARVRVNSGGGNDTVNYTLSSAATSGADVSIDLGDGDDHANVDLSPGVDADSQVTVNGGGGNDTIKVVLGTLTNANMQVNVNGGAGADDISVSTAPSAISALADANSSLHLNVDGGSGDDTIDLSLAGLGDAKVAINVQGGSGNDDISVTTTNVAALTAHTNFSLKVNGNQGDDIIDVALSGMNSDHFRVDLDGGSGDDDISLMATDLAIAANATADVDLDGSAGDDTIVANLGGTFAGNLNFDVEGNSGEDTIFANLTAGVGSTGFFLAKAAGGQGTDDVTLNVVDNSGGVGGASMLAGLHAKILNPLGTDLVAHTDNVLEITTPSSHGNGDDNDNGNDNGHGNNGLGLGKLRGLLNRLEQLFGM